MINAVWTMSNGKAKFKGLSPCHAPLDEVFTAVMLKGILGITKTLIDDSFLFCSRLYLEHVI